MKEGLGMEENLDKDKWPIVLGTMSKVLVPIANKNEVQAYFNSSRQLKRGRPTYYAQNHS